MDKTESDTNRLCKLHRNNMCLLNPLAWGRTHMTGTELALVEMLERALGLIAAEAKKRIETEPLGKE